MKSKINIAIAQMNPTVGDYSGNLEKIKLWISEAEKKHSDIIVFPEMSLCGYPVWDLSNKQRFLKKSSESIQEICKFSKKMKIVSIMGFVDSNIAGESFNALAWIEGGEVKHIYHKKLLPNYDVFLEKIFYKKGTTNPVYHHPEFGNIGLSICEDIWDEDYDLKPLQEISELKADWVINISASPYFRGVHKERNELLKKQALQYNLPILYVNQVGAQDDLIFDGKSQMVDRSGKCIHRLEGFKETLSFFEWDSQKNYSIKTSSVDEGTVEEDYQALVLGVRDYFTKNKFQKALIGLSGGIDSALTVCIAVDALGAEAVKGVTMPSHFSSEGSWRDSLSLAKNLGIECDEQAISGLYDSFQTEIGSDKKKVSLADENLQARLRGLYLMYVSNDEGRLLLTTGNKSELSVGYCTLYGDMCGGLAVLGDIYKTDVFRLSRYRNSISNVIPESIITKPPSAELRPDQKDEDSLPPYEILDEVLFFYIEKNRSLEEIQSMMKEQGVASEVVSWIIEKTDHNEYKRRQTPPILRVSQKAWFGRRMPITNRFQ